MPSLCIITARGGSKRIPRKNVRPFCGKPIIAYSICTAQESGCFDEVMVSTDDHEIAQISREYGAKVPFMRSETASSDYSTTVDVLLEVLGEYAKRSKTFDLGCCIYPTAPFITKETLRSARVMLAENPSILSVMPLVRFSYPIQRALKIKDGLISMFQPEHLNSRSQDLEPAYHDAGQFYWFRTAEFMRSKNIIGMQTAGLILPESQVQDIDTEEDWALAELKYRHIHVHGSLQ